jgi:diacylglycerol kinase (ATP)
MDFSAISIIYNPKSTGSSKRKALELQRALKAKGIAGVRVIPTEHAGHAEELAYELAMTAGKSDKPLIISASGDGGYHEVVNGVMKAQAEGHHVVTGLLPTGNANDHYHSVKSGTAERLIRAGATRLVDLLHVTVTDGDKQWQRYAHSYVGLGLTPAVSTKLNQIKLNPVNEWVVSIREVYKARPSRVIIDGQELVYDSLLFSNIDRVGKVFTMLGASRIDDGKFEIVTLRSKSKAELLRRLAKAIADSRVEGIEQASSFTFQSAETQKMQMDGELHDLQRGTVVEIRSVPRVLCCVI